ncbi:MAG: hypothetical protein ABIQ16_01255 [Polyangiaceae bacterium]
MADFQSGIWAGGSNVGERGWSALVDSHPANPLGFGVEQDGAFGDDRIARGNSRQDLHVFAVLFAGSYFALHECIVRILGEHEELIAARKHCGDRNVHDAVGQPFDLHGGEHAVAQAQIQIRNLDASLRHARQRVDGVTDARDVPDGFLVRERRYMNASFVAHVNARDVLLVDVRHHPQGRYFGALFGVLYVTQRCDGVFNFVCQKQS